MPSESGGGQTPQSSRATASAFSPECLQGRTAIVTGASSGIGAACARSLSQAGARLILTGRHAERLHGVAASLRGEVIEILCDLGEAGAAEGLAKQILAAAPAPDILVNSAGFGDIASTTRATAADIDRVYHVNVRAPLLLIGGLARAMARTGNGSIVNISSVVGSVGTRFQAAYSATKGALEALTRSVAQEFGAQGLRVNAVSPGLIATEMWGNRLDNEELVNACKQYTALNRWGTPEMVADVVTFLASDASRYITGEVLYVDGGLTHTGHLVPPAFF